MIDKTTQNRLQRALARRGYAVTPLGLTLDYPSEFEERAGPNPAGRYLLLDARKATESPTFAPHFTLAPHDVLVVMGRTIANARYFAFNLYQFSTYEERWGKVVETRSSIGEGFNHETLLTANGQSSPFDAPFVIVSGTSGGDNEAVCDAIVETIDDRAVLTERNNINHYPIPPRFTRIPANGIPQDRLNFIGRISLIGQSLGWEAPPEEVEAIVSAYRQRSAFFAFVARPGEQCARIEGRFPEASALERKLDRSVEEMKERLGKRHKVASYREFQAAAPVEFAREIPFDLAWNSPDAMYRLPDLVGLIRKVTLEVPRARHLRKEAVRTLDILPDFELERNDFLVVVGVHYTHLERIAYFNYALYDRDFTPETAISISDSQLLHSLPDADLFAFALVRPDARGIEEEISAAYPSLPVIEAPFLTRPFFFGGRLYLDLVTKGQPKPHDFIPSRILLFEERPLGRGLERLRGRLRRWLRGGDLQAPSTRNERGAVSVVPSLRPVPAEGKREEEEEKKEEGGAL